MKKAKILIVEDESIIAMELEERLMQMGYEVAGVAMDSNSALQKMENHLPDIVMMDIHINGAKDGIETAAEIRSLFGVRVIYLTAHTDPATMQRAAVTEPYGYLLKPFREQEINAAIEMALYKQGMEIKLRESENHLRQAQKIARLGIWDWDIASDQSVWSGEMFNIYGITEETFTGNRQDYLNFTVEEDRPLQLSYIKKLFKHRAQRKDLRLDSDGTRINAEFDPLQFRIIRPDGSIRWVEGNAVTVVNQTGRPLKMIGILVDITERKLADEAIRVSEQKYHELFNSMIDGFALHEIICDEHGTPIDYRYLEVNPAFERLTGLQSKNLIGRTVLEVMPNTEAYWIDIFGHVALTGRPTFYENYYGELGRYFEVSVYCPKPSQFAVIMVDITERKLAEEGIQQHIRELEMLYQSGLALSKLLNPQEIGQKILDVLEQKLNWHHTRIRLYHAQEDRLELLDFNQPDLEDKDQRRKAVSHFQALITRAGQGLSGHVIQSGQPIRTGDVHADARYVESTRGIRSGLYVPMKLGERTIGVISIESEEANAFSEADERLIVTLANQAASAFENARLFEETRQHITELETLYQSGLALSQLLKPKEIAQKVLELLEQKLNWHHTTIRLYRPQDQSLELVDFHQRGVEGEAQKRAVEELFNMHISKLDDGLTGWAVKQSRTIRSGDVMREPHYKETFKGIRSGLYVPIKLGERIVGAISIEDEEPNMFSEADEQLIATLANQAASAFENARLFEETSRRVMELETINRISFVLRAVSKQDEMLGIMLDEALAILNTEHGSIELYNKAADNLSRTVTRGWFTQIDAPPRNSREGIAGKVFDSGEIYTSREFATDPETREAARGQIAAGWGGICLPIHTNQQTLGVLIISVPSTRELDKNEIRLLVTLSEMSGAALQRMQYHEQTLRRLEQLRALRSIDQAINSSFDTPLTLDILLTHTITQLGLDAADVFLLQLGTHQLKLAAQRGFQTSQQESVHLNESFAGRAIIEHSSVLALDLDNAALHKNPQVAELWKNEGFTNYWCVPLRVKGEVKGALEVYRRSAFKPDADWLEFLEALAGQAAIAIDNTQLFENLQSANLDLELAYDATIEGWSRAMDLRDQETEGHTLRVTDLTLKLAAKMKISESQLTPIRRGSLLHDMGKMGIPDSILLKEGTLTADEWLRMRKHPQLAYEMLSPIDYLKDALSIPYCHHEKWDGTGYPRGLKGDEIPLTARIFAICDVWDAVTSNRPYRAAWTQEEALQFIRAQSGLHFDPKVVDAFIDLIKEEE